MPALIEEFSQVSNALALAGIAVTVVAGWWFFYIPRKIGAKASASLPLFWLNSNKLPFFIHVTNTNTRQFKIIRIGFETHGRYVDRRKSCSYELVLNVAPPMTDKSLITEGDSTEISFDGYEIAKHLARGIRDANIRLTSPELKIWLYLTHGTKVSVEADRKLIAKIVAAINEAPAQTNEV